MESLSGDRRRESEEFEELCRVAIATRAQTLAEQLWHDEDLPSETREIFEQGVLSGKFPALSELLSHFSDEEKEDFFRLKVTVAVHSLLDQEKPWDDRPFNGDVDFYREESTSSYLSLPPPFHLPMHRALLVLQPIHT
jgi:hypothetical protein